MLARLRKATEDKDQGFTLIELLVVMIIIGILAAIAIPVFLNQRASARDTATKADVSTAGKEIATYYVNGGVADELKISIASKKFAIKLGTKDVATGNVSDGTAVSGDIKYSSTTDLANNWCVALTNPSGAEKTWKYSAAAGLEKGAC
jgi:type IV pilus assembly protein PilA